MRMTARTIQPQVERRAMARQTPRLVAILDLGSDLSVGDHELMVLQKYLDIYLKMKHMRWLIYKRFSTLMTGITCMFIGL